jgi:hypothetical protein
MSRKTQGLLLWYIFADLKNVLYMLPHSNQMLDFYSSIIPS